MSNPFKGAEPYEEGDKLHGRDREVKALLNFIRTEVLTCLFARSGTGKSSLIRASLISELRDNYYWPVYVHLSQKAAEDSTQVNDLTGYVIALVRESLKPLAQQPEYTLAIPDNFLADPAKGFYSLFDFIENLKISREVPEDQEIVIANQPPVLVTVNLKPVLIFDQFEEIFTLDYGPQKESLNFLLTEINALIENKIPDYLTESLSLPENAVKYQELKKSLISKQKNFRIVFSFREEYMPDFDSLKNIITYIGFTTAKFRLEAFSSETGESVITSIAPSIDAHTANLIVQQLCIQPNANFDKETVDPFLLSLVCQKIYDHIADTNMKDPSDAVIKELVGNAINAHIESVYQRIGHESRVFIEEKLITTDEKRTSFNLTDARKNKAIAGDIDLLLGNQTKDGVKDYRCRLLNSEQLLDTLHVDILHDRLVPPLVKKRAERRIREGFQRRRRIGLIVAASLLLVAGVIGYFIHMRFVYLRKEADQQIVDAMWYKAAEFKAENNNIVAYLLYKSISASPVGKELYQVQLEKVDLGDFDIPCQKGAIRSMRNNYVVASTADSVYMIWHVESNNALTMIKEYFKMSKVLTRNDQGALLAIGEDTLYTFDVEKGRGIAIPVDSTFDKDSPRFSLHQSYISFYMGGRMHLINISDGTSKSYYQEHYVYQALSEVIDTTGSSIFCLYDGNIIRLDKMNDSLKIAGKIKRMGSLGGQYAYLGGDTLGYLKDGSLWKMNLRKGTDELWHKGNFNNLYMAADSLMLLYYYDSRASDKNEAAYQNLTFYDVSKMVFLTQFSTDKHYGRFSVNRGYTRSLLTNPNGEVFLMDINKPEFRAIESMKNVLAYDITDDGKNILYVKRKADSSRKDGGRHFLYVYNIDSDVSRLIDHISADSTITDTTRIYARYFFRTNSASNKVVYKKRVKDTTTVAVTDLITGLTHSQPKYTDTMVVMVRDLATGQILYQSSKMETYVDDNNELDFTNTYIHLRDKNNNEGIKLFNNRPRNLDYFYKLGWPSINDPVQARLIKTYVATTE